MPAASAGVVIAKLLSGAAYKSRRQCRLLLEVLDEAGHNEGLLFLTNYCRLKGWITVTAMKLTVSKIIYL